MHGRLSSSSSSLHASKAPTHSSLRSILQFHRRIQSLPNALPIDAQISHSPELVNNRPNPHTFSPSVAKMADFDAKKQQPNRVLVLESAAESERGRPKELTLFTILNRFIAAVFFPDPDSKSPLPERIKSSLSENVPLLREASRNTARDVLVWTRSGSPFRAILVVSVGTIALLTLTGLLAFTLFFVVATINAVVISLLASLAAAAGFLALFFSCLVAIYIGALTTAIFAISTATISAVIGVLVAAGWIGFFWSLWLGARKSIGLAKRSVSMSGSAVSAYSSAWQARKQNAISK